MLNLENILQELAKPVLYTTWKRYYLNFASAIIREQNVDCVTLAQSLHMAKVICTSDNEEKDYEMESSHIREYGEIVASLNETGAHMNQKEILLAAINNAITKRNLN